jgi:diamine N-acetyltransferase
MSEIATPGDGATVAFREIKGDTMFPICDLSKTLEPRQTRAVAPNVISIAQAYFSSSAWFRGIYADDTPVGFIMLDDQPEKPEYFLWRFMIAKPHQGKGFGRKAIDLLVDYVKTRPSATELLVSCIEGEGSPQGFYESVGFRLTGEKHDSEIELRMDLCEQDLEYRPLPAGASKDIHDLIREYVDRLINQRDTSVCYERLAATYVDHDAPADTLPGPQATIDFMTTYLYEHPDLAVEVEDIIVEDRKAALRLTWRGTDLIGEAFVKSGNVIIHLNDRDEFTERWSCYE